MVKVRKDIPVDLTGEIDVDRWQTQVFPNSTVIKAAIDLARVAGEDVTTPYGHNCFAQCLEMAEKVADLKMGEDAIAATLIYPAAAYAELNLGDIKEQLGLPVYQLVKGVEELHGISELQKGDMQSHAHLDKLRKMLLSMVRDVRVVVIKLSELVSILRNIDQTPAELHLKLAEETMAIHAPLASRLGIHELKWELEDLSFAILNPLEYKTIAKQLNERRIDREARVQLILSTINKALNDANIQGETQGRAKHIFSIYRKMQRKEVGFDQVFDAIAMRLLVPKESDCYKMLGIINEIWTPIPEEFDDYIDHPKPNGYRSIHSAVSDEQGRCFEVQIRTFQMHDESEMGVAAHWMYKEGANASGYEEKIKWLRQLLEWQKELSHDQVAPKALERNVFEDRIYVFTPEGQIIDLVQGATALDFAYHIHTDIGHRCRGAKVGGKITTLTKPLVMGDVVEILTNKLPKPSRDWIIPQRGYLKTSRARAKVLHWFKKQDSDRHTLEGRETLEKELKRMHVEGVNLEQLAHSLKRKTAEAMFSAIGNGELNLAQVIDAISRDLRKKSQTKVTSAPKSTDKSNQYDINIYGVGNLLTHVANCCKPLPGDPIIGYITQEHGVSIHRRDCNNIAYLNEHYQNRIIEVDWEDRTLKAYQVKLEIQAMDRPGLVSDITSVLANDKISIIALNTHTNKKTQIAVIALTIEIDTLENLSKIIGHIGQLPNIVDISRAQSQ
jgi:GTP pyrophosphokinase